MLSFKQEFHNCTFDQTLLDEFETKKSRLLKKNKEKGIFDLKNRKKKYLEIANTALKEIKQAKNLIILGMGGSSLGGKALAGYNFFNKFSKNNQQIFFVDNIHYHNLSSFLENLDFANSHFLIISKSGSTMETLCQTLVLIDYYKKQISDNQAKNFTFITENYDSALGKIAKKLKREIIPHDTDIGGRFSCFTPVALIAAGYCDLDLDLEAYLDGGIEILNDFVNNKNSEIDKSVNFLTVAVESQKTIQVLMPYLHRLYQLTYWFNQLSAESLGKKGKGFTPLKALGSVDQHSILQLFLDGPKDKFFTFLNYDSSKKGDKLDLPDYLEDELGYLKNNYLGDVIFANQNSTLESVIKTKQPVRNFQFQTFNEKALGQIMMHFMLETIYFAEILEVNPYGQPAVEEGKSIARSALKNN
jgi:glucose-6-phosphate isomerase